MAVKRNNKMIFTFSVTLDEPLNERMLEVITRQRRTKTEYVRAALAEKLDRDEAQLSAQAKPNGKKRRK